MTLAVLCTTELTEYGMMFCLYSDKRSGSLTTISQTNNWLSEIVNHGQLQMGN